MSHLHTSLSYRQGRAVKTISERLGHKDTRFTIKLHTHLFEDQRQAAALTMDELLAPPDTNRN
jgi:integrase